MSAQIIKKAVNLLLGLSLLVLLVLPPSAFAQTESTDSASPYSTPTKATQTTDNLFVGLIHTFSCLMEGKSLVRLPCFSSIPNQPIQTLKEQGFLPGNNPEIGFVGLTQSLILGLNTSPPIATSEYLADLQKSLGIVKEAQAQVAGSGQGVISPILKLWQLTRNIAYLAMIVVFLIIGFMIILRSKINPQTVISVQNALPGLVIGLILITFSYFFAALIIDTTFVATNLVGRILESTSPPIIPSGSTPAILRDHNVLTIFNSFINMGEWGNIIGSTQQTLTFIDRSIVGNIINGVLGFVGCQWGWTTAQQLTPQNVIALGEGIGNLVLIAAGVSGCGLAAGTLIGLKGVIIGTILYLILMLALIVAMVRLLFGLINAYLAIIVLTIVAPFYFLAGSFPGKGKLASDWARSMFANILIFPGIFLVFLFAAYLANGLAFQLAGGASVGVSGSSAFTGSSLPMLGGLPTDLIRLLLAYGVLLASPAIPEVIRGLLGVKGLQALAQAATASFQGGMGLGTSGIAAGRGFTGGMYQRGAFNRPLEGLRGVRVAGRTPFGWLPYPVTQPRTGRSP